MGVLTTQALGSHAPVLRVTMGNGSGRVSTKSLVGEPMVEAPLPLPSPGWKVVRKMVDERSWSALVPELDVFVSK